MHFGKNETSFHFYVCNQQPPDSGSENCNNLLKITELTDDGTGI